MEMYLIKFFEGIVTEIKHVVKPDSQGIYFIIFESCRDGVEMLTKHQCKSSFQHVNDLTYRLQLYLSTK